MNRAISIFLRSFRQNADFLALILVLQFWPILTKSALNLRTALTLAGLCIVYRLSGMRSTETQNPAATEELEKREFVDDSEAVLKIAKLTGYDAVRRLTPYLGKWITISGRFEGLAESLQRDAIHLSLLLNDGRRINLRFGVEHGERLRALREGQRITAIGRIPRFGLEFTPENCELVRVEPVRLAYAS